MREVQFQVYVVCREAEGIFVGGRNCKEEVVLGDVLTVRGQQVPTGAAKVRGILTYRRRMNTLDVGMTGELELVVQEADEIVAGCELVGSFREPAPKPLVLGMGEFHVKAE
jgi:hypothetical protein